MNSLQNISILKYCCLCFVCWLLLENLANGQTTSLSVQELIEKKSEWRSFKDPIKVEGRVSLLNSNQLLFNKLEDDITFKWNTPDIHPGKFYNNAEVYGKLELVVNKWIFTVLRIEEKPADLTVVSRKSSGLPVTDPAPWYELAKWCSNRAKFYSDDPELLKKALEFKTKGISIARGKITTQDGEALIKLALEVQQLGLSNTLIEEFQHEGFYYLYLQGLKTPANVLPDLAKRIQQTLSGSLNQFNKAPQELLANYQKSPLETYKQSPAENRRLLERLLYRDVILGYVNSLATANFSTAGTQAKILQQSLPEEVPLYQKYIEQDLEYRTAGISTKTRQEAIELANEYKSRNQPERAKKLLETWMNSRKVSIPKDRLQDRLDLADDYIKLLNDKDKSRDELIALFELYPSDTTISDRLSKLGFVRQNGKWIPSEVAQSTATKPAINIYPGLKVGMTREQVFSEIGGPSTITRAFAQGSMLEVWDYSDHHLSISFHASSKNSLSVKEIINTNPQRK